MKIFYRPSMTLPRPQPEKEDVQISSATKAYLVLRILMENMAFDKKTAADLNSTSNHRKFFWIRN